MLIVDGEREEGEKRDIERTGGRAAREQLRQRERERERER